MSVEKRLGFDGASRTPKTREKETAKTHIARARLVFYYATDYQPSRAIPSLYPTRPKRKADSRFYAALAFAACSAVRAPRRRVPPRHLFALPCLMSQERTWSMLMTLRAETGMTIQGFSVM